MHSTGFCVPCTVSASWSRFGICQSVVCLRSPAQWPGPAHGIPAGLVLPVIIAAAQHQPVLGPDDLRADVEAAGVEALGHRRGVQRAVPDIGDVAREQRPGLAPVGAVVVQHLAGALGLRRRRACCARPDRSRRRRADR